MSAILKSEQESETHSEAAPLLSSIVSALSTEASSFTGERFVFGSGVEIFYEHYHRYIFASSHITKADVVLDLGCGVGYGSILLAGKAKKVIAVDRDKESIALLQGLIDRHGITNIQAVCANVSEIGELGIESIDTVVCHELIEHLPQADQLALLKRISSCQQPFHRGTKLFLSTPEKATYNKANSSRNEFHEFEFSRGEFQSFVLEHFKHAGFYWQGSATGNVIVKEGDGAGPTLCNFVEWHDINKLWGTASPTPLPFGEYMYAIASHTPLNLNAGSVLIDQKERLFAEKLAIAVKEFNLMQQRLVKLTEQSESQSARASLDQLSIDKIHALLRENEELGARMVESQRLLHGRSQEYEARIAALQRLLHGRSQEYEARIAALQNPPLEVKLAQRCMERMPSFIRKTIRRCVAAGIALVRG